MTRRRYNRRTFVKLSLAATGSTVVPWILPGISRSSETPSERLRVGCIGVGGRGTHVGNTACKLGVKVACADVDRERAERFADDGCTVYADYRKLLERQDIDVVTIGTPDHWHTKIVIDAVRAGKDVYCEKPLTLTIDEGKKLAQAVRESQRIVQIGTQQRSSAQFLLAVAVAQSGRLGRVLKATCFLGRGPVGGGPFPVQDPPPHLDWNTWLGQCPEVPYTRLRCHGAFRWWLEYSGGKLTDWGAHHLDIAQWALGYDKSGPVAVEGKGTFAVIPDDFDPVAFFAGDAKLPNAFNTAAEFDVTLRFANGSSMVVRHGPGNGILIEGEQGRIYVNRARLSGEPIEKLTAAERDTFAQCAVELYRGKPIDPWGVSTDAKNSGRDQATTDHMRHFFACVADRSQPVSDVFTHHRSVSSCHLCNIAMLLRRKLRWDPDREDFVGDEQASAVVARPQRAGFEVSG